MAYIVYIYILVAILVRNFKLFDLVVWVVFRHLLDVLLVQNRIIFINTVDHSEVVNIYKVESCFQKCVDIVLTAD